MFKAVRKKSGKDGSESNYGKHFWEQEQIIQEREIYLKKEL